MLLTDADQLREALAIALHERDEARAEVERLRECGEELLDEGLVFFYGHERMADVARRQREACAAYLRNRMKEANEDHLSVDYVRGLRAAVVYADATPLVTEGKT